MGPKSIAYVAVFSGVMGLFAAVVSFVSTLQAVVHDKAGMNDAALGLVALAFVTICLLGGGAAAALKKQADEIVLLRSELSGARRV